MTPHSGTVAIGDANVNTGASNRSANAEDNKNITGEQIELVEPGSSASAVKTDKEYRERARLGWTPWRREKMKTDEDNNGNPLEQVRSNEELLREEDGEERAWDTGRYGEGVGEGRVAGMAGGEEVFKVYKRRWFGLAQLVLLNVVVSWDWLSYAPVSTTSSQYFGVSLTAINWIATTFLFAFCVATPFAMYSLHYGGPKQSIVVASVLLLLGNWIRYAGTKTTNIGAVYFGQILTGLAQPFVLAAPTSYSDLWFTSNGRVAATAVMSLANPLGGALGQLINPFWADENPKDIPNMILYISIIATVASVPSFFIPAAPPTLCAPSANHQKLAILPSLRILFSSPEFYLILLPFNVYVGLFNSLSSLLNSILYPYGFTEEEAGIAGALLIVVGLVVAAIISPIIDKSKKFLLAIKLQIPVVAICYLTFIWAPPTKGVGAVYAILALLGAASFSLVPVALEFVTEITYPVSPEIASVICWSGGQLLGGIFIVISDQLTDGPQGGPGGDVPGNMQRALWFHAAVGVVVAFCPLFLGLFGRKEHVRLKRVEADRAYRRGERHGVEA